MNKIIAIFRVTFSLIGVVGALLSTTLVAIGALVSLFGVGLLLLPILVIVMLII